MNNSRKSRQIPMVAAILVAISVIIAVHALEILVIGWDDEYIWSPDGQHFAILRNMQDPLKSYRQLVLQNSRNHLLIPFLPECDVEVKVRGILDADWVSNRVLRVVYDSESAEFTLRPAHWEGIAIEYVSK